MDHKTALQRRTSFPNDFCPSESLSELEEKYTDCDPRVLQRQCVSVGVCGRMVSRRVLGRAAFATLQDLHGTLQLYVASDAVSPKCYARFKKWRINSVLGASGCLFKTRTNALSVRCTRLRVLVEPTHSLPKKGVVGLRDKEQRYRRRYADLIVNEKTRRTFRMRSKILREIRLFMEHHRFVEVETPMLQSTPDGASARPFASHCNALGDEAYWRVSPELHLKQLLVGGFDRVFEINRNFRNENASAWHSPEFTMMEFYAAYSTGEELMEFVQRLLRVVAERTIRRRCFRFGPHRLDLDPPFRRMTMQEAIGRHCPDVPTRRLRDAFEARDVARRVGVPTKPHWRAGRIQSEIFERLVERKLIQPTFVTAYPVDVSPLARVKDDDPFATDRFELFMAGREMGNGFSELNDPVEQQRRFRRQNRRMGHDGYIVALEHGLPPAAGCGIGIDRLVMLITDNSNIRDVALFPLLRAQRPRRGRHSSLGRTAHS